MRRITAKFTVFELIVIALMAALGVAVKPVVSSLAQIITGPLGIPKGALAGGIYMMFLVLAYRLTRGRLAGTLTGLIQAILVIITGIAGSQGIFSLITYLLPGVAVDLVMLIFALCKQKRSNPAAGFCAGMAANVTGSFLVGLITMDILNTLPLVYLLLALSAAALSGGLGGVIAGLISVQIEKTGILNFNSGGDNP